MNIEIKGVEFSNKGAELMMMAILDQINQNLPEAEIVMEPGLLAPYKSRAAIGAWQKCNFQIKGRDIAGLINVLPRAILNRLKHFGILAEKDIDVVLDASGFGYGDNWGSASLKRTLAQIKRIKSHGGKYIFLPQAFGPFNDAENADIAREMFEEADLIVARDHVSFDAIQGLGEFSHLVQFPDFTPLYASKTLTKNADLAVIIPNHKMVSSFNQRDERPDDESYLTFLCAMARHLADNQFDVVVLNHEGKEDRQLCEQVIAEIPEARLVDGLNAVEVKHMIGESAVCVSSRFHGCVSGLSQGVPTLATSWSHKYEQLYAYYQKPELVIDLSQDISDVQDKLTHVLDNFTMYASDLTTSSIHHKQAIEQMWKTVFSVINEQ